MHCVRGGRVALCEGGALHCVRGAVLLHCVRGAGCTV